MTENIILSPIPIDTLTGLLATIVRQELQTQSQLQLQEQFLSPKEVCKLFSPAISIATLNNWSDKGLIRKHYIGKLTFYKYVEVLDAVKALKKYQRKAI